MYPEFFIAPMREELTQLGVKELRTVGDVDEAEAHYGVRPKASLDGANGYHCVIGAVAHDAYTEFTPKTFDALLEPGGVIADVKGMWRKMDLPAGYRRWQL